MAAQQEGERLIFTPFVPEPVSRRERLCNDATVSRKLDFHMAAFAQGRGGRSGVPTGDLTAVGGQRPRSPRRLRLPAVVVE